MKTVDLVYFNAGGGHRAAALALEAVAREQGRPWRVRLVDLFKVLDPQASFRRWAGFAPEDFYNKRLATGFTLGLAQELKLLQGLIRLGHPALVRTLRQHWLASEPDLVVSLVPNFNRALWHSVATALPGVPFVTVMTDLADHPPNFWIEPGQPQHLVCGSERAVQQARAAGYPAARVHRSSGMILRPEFHRTVVPDRAAGRAALGLPADEPTGVVLFGGQGSNVMLRIAQALPHTPLILLCGHNEALAAKLRALPTGQVGQAPRIVVGHTREVARYMQLGDFFIGKPGPGSLSEAVQSGLPVIVTRNAWTMPQERYNTDWVQQQGIGLVLKSFRPVAGAVAALTAQLPAYRAAVRRLDNHAVFEVPDILQRVLDEAATLPRSWRTAPALTVGVAAT